jgi:branched-chain amino acid transport system permease protein
MAFFDIFLLESVINGVLLGGVLALLALGLNLVFGVIDVVWICYAELVMLGMYAVFFLHTEYGLPLPLAFATSVAIVTLLGVVLHVLIIQPVLDSEPINQLLVTGGVLFFLQAAATVAFGIDFRNLGVRMPVLEIGDMFLSASRLAAFAVALVAMVLLWLFLTRTYMGTAIRAIAQDRQIMPLMGVDPKRIYLVVSGIGGGMAGVAACLLVLQYDVHPALGLTFGPITFMICVLGGLGNLIGGFIAAFLISQIIAVGSYVHTLEWGYVFAFVFFILMILARPQGLFQKR